MERIIIRRLCRAKSLKNSGLSICQSFLAALIEQKLRHQFSKCLSYGHVVGRAKPLESIIREAGGEMVSPNGPMKNRDCVGHPLIGIRATTGCTLDFTRV